MKKSTEEKKEEVKTEKSKLYKDIILNLAYAVIITMYFMSLNLLYSKLPANELTLYLKLSSLVVLGIAIVIIETAYKKDSGTLGLYGIEYGIIATYTLLIEHALKIYKVDFKIYTLTGVGVFIIYYILKSIIFYTKQKRAELESFSDIKEIVKEEPVKKETKRKKKEKKNND